MEESIFSQEWRRCLREHYKHVVRSEDKVTEESLTKVLRSQAINFSEDELRKLYVEATMRDMPDDFVPDMEKATEPDESPVPNDPKSEQTFVAHPAECTCAACMETSINEDLHDEEGQPLSTDALEERKEEQEKQSGNATNKQMSMF